MSTDSSAHSRAKTVEWGHWAITFSEHDIDEYGRRGYAPAVIHGWLQFPVGVCGPADMPKHDEYMRAIRDWTVHGVLPDGLLRDESFGDRT